MINPSTLDPISLMKYNMQLNRMLEEECSDVSTDEPNANDSKLQSVCQCVSTDKCVCTAKSNKSNGNRRCKSVSDASK